MDKALEETIRQLQQHSSAHVAGAVKTFPLRELLKSGRLIQGELLNTGSIPYQKEELQLAYDKIQDIITKRIKAARKIIDKFSKSSPEVIALNISMFALVPSRDVLEDVKTAYGHSEERLRELTQASNNILEAVNIEIQQRFYNLPPESIAVNYSGEELNSYRKLLKNLLTHIEVDSDIFKVYSTIIRNVVDGCRIHETQISVARQLCQRIFQTTPPNFEEVFTTYSLDELEVYQETVKAALNILERDITVRPSTIDFSTQCRQILDAFSNHFVNRKILMRKTTRVLQLSHHVAFLSTENVSENASVILMLCEDLFREVRKFLIRQREHLDVMLNVKSIEEAEQKLQEGIRYRQFSIGQLFQEISKLGSDDLTFVSEKWLRDSNLLLQEIQNLVEEYIRRTPHVPQASILDLGRELRENVEKLHNAIDVAQTTPGEVVDQPWELDRTLPNLSKFYDEELVGLIRKAMKSGQSIVENEEFDILETLSIISVDLLQKYIEAFIKVIKTPKPGRSSVEGG
jgi:hypothetical protein